MAGFKTPKRDRGCDRWDYLPCYKAVQIGLVRSIFGITKVCHKRNTNTRKKIKYCRENCSLTNFMEKSPLVKKNVTFYGNLRFITVYTRVSNCWPILTQTSPISILQTRFSPRSSLILFSHLRQGL